MKLHEEKKIDSSRTRTSTTPLFVTRFALFTSFFIASLKRLALNLGSSLTSFLKKRQKLIDSKLIYQTIKELESLMSNLSTSIVAKTKSQQERASKIIQEHYTNLFDDNRLILANIIEKEIKARTFTLLKSQNLQRRWVENRIDERIA